MYTRYINVTMEPAAITILPWAEYMMQIPTLENGDSSIKTLTGIDMTTVRDLSCENEALKHILESDKNGQILRVRDQRDLEDVAAILFGPPILMRITLIHTEVASKYTADTVSIWEGDYAIVVNTNHASVKSQFTQAFSNASQYVDTGWRFCIEIDLADIVEGWYLQNIEVMSGCDDFQTTKTKGSRIFITNHKIYNHCYDCGPRWWLCLTPCWLMVAPCYFIYRRLSCKDVRIKLKADVASITSLRKIHTETDSNAIAVVNYRPDDNTTMTTSLKKTNPASEQFSYGTV